MVSWTLERHSTLFWIAPMFTPTSILQPQYIHRKKAWRSKWMSEEAEHFRLPSTPLFGDGCRINPTKLAYLIHTLNDRPVYLSICALLRTTWVCRGMGMPLADNGTTPTAKSASNMTLLRDMDQIVIEPEAGCKSKQAKICTQFFTHSNQNVRR